MNGRSSMKIFDACVDWLYDVVNAYHSECGELFIGVISTVASIWMLMPWWDLYSYTTVIKYHLGLFEVVYGALGTVLGLFQLWGLRNRYLRVRLYSSAYSFLFWTSVETMLILSDYRMQSAAVVPIYIIASMLNYLKLSKQRGQGGNTFTVSPG